MGEVLRRTVVDRLRRRIAVYRRTHDMRQARYCQSQTNRVDQENKETLALHQKVLETRIRKQQKKDAQRKHDRDGSDGGGKAGGQPSKIALNNKLKLGTSGVGDRQGAAAAAAASACEVGCSREAEDSEMSPKKSMAAGSANHTFSHLASARPFHHKPKEEDAKAISPATLHSKNSGGDPEKELCKGERLEEKQPPCKVEPAEEKGNHCSLQQSAAAAGQYSSLPDSFDIGFESSMVSDEDFEILMDDILNNPAAFHGILPGLTSEPGGDLSGRTSSGGEAKTADEANSDCDSGCSFNGQSGPPGGGAHKKQQQPQQPKQLDLHHMHSEQLKLIVAQQQYESGHSGSARQPMSTATTVQQAKSSLQAERQPPPGGTMLQPRQGHVVQNVYQQQQQQQQQQQHQHQHQQQQQQSIMYTNTPGGRPIYYQASTAGHAQMAAGTGASSIVQVRHSPAPPVFKQERQATFRYQPNSQQQQQQQHVMQEVRNIKGPPQQQQLLIQHQYVQRQQQFTASLPVPLAPSGRQGDEEAAAARKQFHQQQQQQQAKQDQMAVVQQQGAGRLMMQGDCLLDQHQQQPGGRPMASTSYPSHAVAAEYTMSTAQPTRHQPGFPPDNRQHYVYMEGGGGEAQLMYPGNQGVRASPAKAGAVGYSSPRPGAVSQHSHLQMAPMMSGGAQPPYSSPPQMQQQQQQQQQQYIQPPVMAPANASLGIQGVTTESNHQQHPPQHLVTYSSQPAGVFAASSQQQPVYQTSSPSLSHPPPPSHSYALTSQGQAISVGGRKQVGPVSYSSSGGGGQSGLEPEMLLLNVSVDGGGGYGLAPNQMHQSQGRKMVAVQSAGRIHQQQQQHQQHQHPGLHHQPPQQMHTPPPAICSPMGNLAAAVSTAEGFGLDLLDHSGLPTSPGSISNEQDLFDSLGNANSEFNLFDEILG